MGPVASLTALPDGSECRDPIFVLVENLALLRLWRRRTVALVVIQPGTIAPWPREGYRSSPVRLTPLYESRDSCPGPQDGERELIYLNRVDRSGPRALPRRSSSSGAEWVLARHGRRGALAAFDSPSRKYFRENDVVPTRGVVGKKTGGRLSPGDDRLAIDDFALMDAVASRDQGAFSVFYDRHASALLGV